MQFSITSISNDSANVVNSKLYYTATSRNFKLDILIAFIQNQRISIWIEIISSLWNEYFSGDFYYNVLCYQSWNGWTTYAYPILNSGRLDMYFLWSIFFKNIYYLVSFLFWSSDFMQSWLSLLTLAILIDKRSTNNWWKIQDHTKVVLVGWVIKVVA